VIKTTSIAKQVADHLVQELEQGRWRGLMPGRKRLATELGVNARTVDRALLSLEERGYLQSQGAGKRRRILKKAEGGTAPALQVEMLLYEPADAYSSYILELRRALEAAGHGLRTASKTLSELKQDPQRVAEMVEVNPTRAWIVQSASRPVLEWFAQEKIPTFALFGTMTKLPIAGTGPDLLPALRESLQKLFTLGHGRIVMLTRGERRGSSYGAIEQTFLDLLQAQGIETGSYNLPAWEETTEGLRQCLDRLFAITPPTAIFITDNVHLLAVENYLARRRGRKFRNVTLISTAYHQHYDWCDPTIPHFKWEFQEAVRQVVNWVEDLVNGKVGRRQKLIRTRFVGGEAIQKV
jgi:DNA-binding LacI/PurR family transcriptional regulator